MKTKSFWLMLAVAVAFSGLTSCEKDVIDEPIVVDSELLDTGIDSNISENTGAVGSDGTQGTTLSYKSWIKLNVETRSTERTIEVTLKNTVATMKKNVSVNNFKLGKAGQPTVEYRKGEARVSEETRYITITDSILVYRIPYDNFNMEFEFIYQVAVYDDGITKQTMPYLKYDVASLRVGEHKVSDIGGQMENENIFSCKHFAQSAFVDFKGKTYQMDADITLRRQVGHDGQPKVVASKVLSTQCQAGKTSVTTEAKVEYLWSNGNKSESTLKKELTTTFIDKQVDALILEQAPPVNVNPTVSLLPRTLTEGMSDESGIRVNDVVQSVEVNFGDFKSSADILYQEAFFDDGYTNVQLASLIPDKVTGKLTDLGKSNPWTEDNGEVWISYGYIYEFTVYFGTHTVEGRVNRVVHYRVSK